MPFALLVQLRQLHPLEVSGCVAHDTALGVDKAAVREVRLLRNTYPANPFNPINPLLILRILTICVKSVGEHRCLRYFNNGLSGLNGFVGGVFIGLNGVSTRPPLMFISRAFLLFSCHASRCSHPFAVRSDGDPAGRNTPLRCSPTPSAHQCQ